MPLCPCCSNKEYPSCCQPFLDGKQAPTSPEELMRSRYTAYTKTNIDYIIRTMKSPAADGFNIDSARKWAQRTVWIKLEVISSSQNDNKGYVEFIAHLFQNKKRTTLHEISEFHLENDQWYYVDGKYL